MRRTAALRTDSEPDGSKSIPAGTHGAAPVENGTSPAPLLCEQVLSEPWENQRASARAQRAALARKLSPRRRHVDPATSERDYTDDEIEFMRAMQDYKHRSGRMFPTWSEVLEVLAGLGYCKCAEPADD